MDEGTNVGSSVVYGLVEGILTGWFMRPDDLAAILDAHDVARL
jgi:hypothetical protein